MNQTVNGEHSEVAVAPVPESLAGRYDGFIVDADGVLYRGHRVVDHARAALAWVTQQADRPWGVVTNNAAHTPQEVAERLHNMGFEFQADHVITSSQGAAAYLQQRGVESGAEVLVVGGLGIETALQAAGFHPTRKRTADLAAVVQGFGPDLRWADLAEASYAIEGGALWVATNADLTLPTAEGLAPGNGSLVGAVVNAVGRTPDAVTGKPAPLLMNLAAERWGLEHPLVIGDRLDTDIAGGIRAGMDTLLVLTGVTGKRELIDLVDAPDQERPRYLARDLRALLEPAHASEIVGSGSVGSVGSVGPVNLVEHIRVELARAWTAAPGSAGDQVRSHSAARVAQLAQELFA